MLSCGYHLLSSSLQKYDNCNNEVSVYWCLLKQILHTVTWKSYKLDCIWCSSSKGIILYWNNTFYTFDVFFSFSSVYHAADIGIAMIILVAFTFIPVGGLLYAVTEFINREKHMQFINGVGSFLYWISALVWDLVC